MGVTRQDPKRPGAYYPVFGMVRLAGRCVCVVLSRHNGWIRAESNMYGCNSIAGVACPHHPNRYKASVYREGQKLEVHVDSADAATGRLLLSLTPVYRRPSHDPETGDALPLHELSSLTVGMPLQGRVVSVTEHYAFLDCGVLRPLSQKDKSKRRRRLNGKLYRLDLMERWALDPRQRTATTEAVLAPGMDVPQVCDRDCVIMVMAYKTCAPFVPVPFLASHRTASAGGCANKTSRGPKMSFPTH